MVDLAKAEELVATLVRQARTNKLAAYQPYPKQAEFHRLGTATPYRLFMAGSQLGKTFSGAAEAAMHLTGRYPHWWAGKRFARATKAWAVGVTNVQIRESVQVLLLGEPGQPGTGMIPADTIVETASARGIPGAFDYITVKHVSGGLSRLSLKSAQAGREAFQGATLDFIWVDEQPPEDIFAECMARLTQTKGILWMTFTPLKGRDAVVNRFLDEPDPTRSVTIMTIRDLPFYSAEMEAEYKARYPRHEWECRLFGVPARGEGAIFIDPEEIFVVPPFDPPMHWPRIVGLDIGISHPTAAAWIAWDRDLDVAYMISEYRAADQKLAVHAAAIQAKGAEIPVAWPHDVAKREHGSGVPIAAQFKAAGLRMLPGPAQFADGSNSVEAGLQMMVDRFASGRLKIFASCPLVLEEIRRYHRKDGLVVKIHDDLICALRYGLVMMGRHARVVDSAGRRVSSVSEAPTLAPPWWMNTPEPVRTKDGWPVIWSSERAVT